MSEQDIKNKEELFSEKVSKLLDRFSDENNISDEIEIFIDFVNYLKELEKDEIKQKQDLELRIEARTWCGPIETDRGASENEVENIAIHFFKKGAETERKKNENYLNYARTCMLNSVTSKLECTLCQNKYCPLNEVHKQ